MYTLVAAVAQWVKNPTVTARVAAEVCRSPSQHSGLKDPASGEGHNCSFDLIPGLAWELHVPRDGQKKKFLQGKYTNDQ